MTDENIGKDVAARLSEEVKRRILRANAEAEEKASAFLFAQRLERAASGFSVQVRHEGSLVVERQSAGVTFHFFGDQTLSVDIRPKEILLQPAQSNGMPLKLFVSRAVDGTRTYRFFNPNPTIRTPELSEDEVVKGIIRMAVGEPFSD